MRRRLWRKVATALALLILLQPFASIASYSFANTPVAYAEETEDKKKPKPGVSNADDDSTPATQGSSFPSKGSGNKPIYTNPNGNNGGGSNDGGNGKDVITDPTENLKPSRPGEYGGDRYDRFPEVNPGDGGDVSTGGTEPDVDPEQGDPSSGGDITNTDGDVSTGEGTVPDVVDPNGGDGHNGGAEGGGTRPDGADPSAEGTDPENNESTKLPDIISDYVSGGKDTAELVEILTDLVNNGEISSADALFFLEHLRVSDNEDVQNFYSDIISNLSNAKDVADEIKDAHKIRYGADGKLKFRDWLNPKTYTDTFFSHTKDSMDPVYRELFNEEKAETLAKKDKGKFKLSSPFKWLGNKLGEGISKVKDIAQGGLERGLQLAGKGLSTISNGISTLFDKGIEGITGLRNTVGHLLNNTDSSIGRTLLSGVDWALGAANKGLSGLGKIGQTISSAGNWLSNSSVGKMVGNAVDGAKSLGASLWQSGKNIVGKVSNSKFGSMVKTVANSPIGKIGGGLLSGLSIWSGAMDIAGDGAWNTKVSGGLAIASGVLGIGAAAFAGTVAAPVLVGGAFIAGVASLGFTYGPKIYNAVRNSRFGKWVGKQWNRGVDAVRSGWNSARDAVSNTISNIGDNIASGFSSLFGR